jgi:hypothetical protein
LLTAGPVTLGFSLSGAGFNGAMHVPIYARSYFALDQKTGKRENLEWLIGQ